VRLAAKLTGWKIDIKSEEEKRKEVEIQLGALEIGETPADGDGATGEEAALDATAPGDEAVSDEAGLVAASAETAPEAAADATPAPEAEAGEPAADSNDEGRPQESQT
jgi:N utilization substance protein A